MAKLTFGQEAIQHIINQGRIEMGIANTIKHRWLIHLLG
jgi:hypothetical protein